MSHWCVKDPLSSKFITLLLLYKTWEQNNKLAREEIPLWRKERKFVHWERWNKACCSTLDMLLSKTIPAEESSRAKNWNVKKNTNEISEQWKKNNENEPRRESSYNIKRLSLLSSFAWTELRQWIGKEK